MRYSCRSLSHKGVGEKRRYSSTHSEPQHYINMCCWHQNLDALPSVKNASTHWINGCVGPRTCMDVLEERKFFAPPRGLEDSRFFAPPLRLFPRALRACSLVTILTELDRRFQISARTPTTMHEVLRSFSQYLSTNNVSAPSKATLHILSNSLFTNLRSPHAVYLQLLTKTSTTEKIKLIHN
jgi:hypothetical protein